MLVGLLLLSSLIVSSPSAADAFLHHHRTARSSGSSLNVNALLWRGRRNDNAHSSSASVNKSSHSRRRVQVHYELGGDDSFSDNADAAGAEFLPLSASDVARIAEARSRRLTVPILILDAILPGQTLQFGSPDPKFRKLIEHALRSGSGEVGMIGMNPHTGRPLNIGVMVPISTGTIQFDPSSGSGGMLTISVRGGRRFEVQGEPWMDDTESFYVADVEIVEGRAEIMDSEEEARADNLSAAIPAMVEKWLKWVIQSGSSSLQGMERRMEEMGPMPREIGKRAIWVATMLNPNPALADSVCLEIRPAMLACRNDLERMNLAAIALQSSIDHLSGKRPLF